jgi:hypothetical protein
MTSTGTSNVLLASNGRMPQCFPHSPWLALTFAVTFFLSVANRSTALQPPAQQSEQRNADELKLTAAEEKDSYEIYSMLLRMELPPQWKLAAWAIRREAQTFPNHGLSNGNNLHMCLDPSQDQKSIYLPLIEDYAARNKKKLVLERKFDLPQYALIGPAEIKPIQMRSRVADGFPFNASVIFHVSAVGFNREGTRALVYVGHDCGNLCDGGGYHLLVKKDGQWQVDREYRGLTCTWEK